MDDPKIVGGSKRSGMNHYLSKSEFTTLCGQHKPSGWEPPHPDGKICVRCSEAGYNSVTNRPLPHNTKGSRSV